MTRKAQDRENNRNTDDRLRPKSTTYSDDLLNAGLVWPLRYTPDFGRLSGRRLGLVVFPFVHSQRR